MTKMQSVRDWLLGCPELAGRRVGVDFLAAEPGSAALESRSDRVDTLYADGSAKRRLELLLSLRPAYGDDIAADLEALAALERIAGWVSSARTGFAFDGGRVYSVEASDPGCVYYADARSAKYQLRLAVTYFTPPPGALS